MCIFIVPRKHRRLADEIIAAIRNSRLSLSTSLELAEEALRQSYLADRQKILLLDIGMEGWKSAMVAMHGETASKCLIVTRCILLHINLMGRNCSVPQLGATAILNASDKE